MYPEKSARRRNKLAGSKWPKIWRTADMRAHRTMRITWSSRRDYRCLFSFIPGVTGRQAIRRNLMHIYPTVCSIIKDLSFQNTRHATLDPKTRNKKERKHPALIYIDQGALRTTPKSAADAADKKRRKIIIQTRSRCVRPENSRNRCRAELIEYLSPSASFSSAPPGSCRLFASGVDAGARLYSATRQGALPVLTVPGAPARQTR